MKRFEFRLDPVVRLKTQYLELEEGRLRKLIQEEKDLEAAKQKAIDDLRAQESFLASGGSIRGETLLGYAAFQTQTENQLREFATRISECRREQQSRRERILELERERELLERLRARRHREWTLQLDKEIDNLAHEAFLSRLSRDAEAE